MGQTVNLTKVDLTQINDNINLIVEENSELKRLNTSELLSDLQINKADNIQSKFGKIITANNGAHTPLKGLRIFGKTTQNGTPSPDAPVPLESVGDGGSIVVSVAGKNLIDFSKRLPGYELTGNIDIDRQIKANNKWYVTDWIPVEPLTQYTVSGLSSTFCLQVDKNYKGIKVTQVGNTFRTQENVRFLRFNSIQEGYATPQLEKGSTATEYEPYKGQILTLQTPNGLPGIHVSEGGNYTDENGWQWICDEVDFARGKYVQNVYYHTFNGTESDISYVAGTNWYIAKPLATLAYGRGAIISSHYPANARTNVENTGYLNSSGLVVFNDKSFTNADALKTHLAANPVTVCYPLATPIETDLTPEQLAAYAALHTLSPNTTIYNDGGAYMEVKYYTPNTAVQMVHSPADEGKVLAIDEHGCVVLSNEVGGSIDIELEGSTEGRISPVNADTLGGVPAEEYIKKTVSVDDEGKILRVVNGVATWTSIPNVREGSF